MVRHRFTKPGHPQPCRTTLLPGPALAAHSSVARDNALMDIMLNGDPLALPDDCTVAGLLESQGLTERRVAVELNGDIVPRGRHAGQQLAAGDRVEIVHALGGG